MTTKQDKTRHTDIKVDATCADAEVKYPTGCGLLEDSARFIKRMVKKACELPHIPVPRNNCSLIHARFIRLTKLRHKGKKVREETVRYMLSHIHKDIMKLLELLPSVWNSLNITDKRTMTAVIKAYHQQECVFKNGIHTCKDRIVSIFQPHVRPIVRVKAGAQIEFGGKIGVSVVDGYTYIDHHSWDAYNESADFDTHVTLYEELFGRRLLVDGI